MKGEIITVPVIGGEGNRKFQIIQDCSGHCCKVFQLSGNTLPGIQELAINATDEEGKKKLQAIHDMLIPLTLEEIIERIKTAKPDILLAKWGELESRKDEIIGRWFTCKHLTIDNKCANYENRPTFCRIYPFQLSMSRSEQAKCDFEDCTLEYKEITTEKDLPKQQNEKETLKMNEKTERTPENPISEIIDDATYAKLTELQLLDEKGIRNYVMKQEYAELRKTHKQGETLDIMAQKYVYIQPDTIKSIVSRKNKGAIV